MNGFPPKACGNDKLFQSSFLKFEFQSAKSLYVGVPEDHRRLRRGRKIVDEWIPAKSMRGIMFKIESLKFIF